MRVADQLEALLEHPVAPLRPLPVDLDELPRPWKRFGSVRPLSKSQRSDIPMACWNPCQYRAARDPELW